MPGLPPTLGRSSSKSEDLFKGSHRVVGASHRVANRAAVGENLVVVPALVRLVAKEVDRREALVLDETERVGLVPPVGAFGWCVGGRWNRGEVVEKERKGREESVSSFGRR